MRFVAAITALSALFVVSAFLPDYYLVVLCYVGLATITAIGLVLLTGEAGITSFGQAAFVGIGAYTTGVVTSKFGYPPLFGLFAGLVITSIAAFVIGAATLTAVWTLSGPEYDRLGREPILTFLVIWSNSAGTQVCREYLPLYFSALTCLQQGECSGSSGQLYCSASG